MEQLPVLYVFVRTDLPSMNPGKAQAHSGHAANAFIHKNVVQVMRGCKVPIAKSVLEWMASTPFGFGTQINLKGNWPDVINTVAAWAEVGRAELVIDPTYPYIVDEEIVTLIDPRNHSMDPVPLGNGKVLCHRNEVTAAYLFGYKEELEPFVGKYPLHP